MKIIDLSNVELFKDLLCIDFDEKSIDLHNEYHFKKYKFSESQVFTLVFENEKNLKELFVCFEKTKFVEFSIEFDEDSIIDNFYRGRYLNGQELCDTFEDKKCFYIEFTGNSTIVLLASKLTFEI